MSDSTRGGRQDAIRAVLAFTFRQWARQTGLVAAIGLAMAGATLADILIPVFTGRLVDALGRPDRAAALDAALTAFAAMAGLGIAMLVLRQLAWAGIIPLTLRIMTDAARESFHRVQRLSTDWHGNSFAGSTVRKITRGMWAIDTMDDVLLLALFPSALVLVGSTLLFAIRWPAMGLVVGFGAVAYVAAALLMSTRYIAPAARLANRWDTRMGGVIADALGCNAVVKAFGAEGREEARLAGVLDKWRRRTARTWGRHTASGTAQVVILWLIRTGVTATSLVLWWQGRASPGDITYVLATYFVVAGYLRDVGQHINQLQRSVNDMEDLVAIHDEDIGVADRPGAPPIRITAGELRFDRVTFHYGGHTLPLYQDLSVTVRGGERVGLVGHSGSGKTTFIKLVQRLYDVTGGRVLIDGQDVAGVGQASLRSQIAVVAQDPILFHRSLAENIGYGRPAATLAEIEAAARLANAHDFIARLPKGYGTMVGERGVKLSGGERQRVALARAFLADAPILILDEATSSLDSESEALIQEAMERLMAGRTAIVIAHRLSTVQRLDRILVFERGTIVEEGAHAALMSRPGGLYRRLFDRQFTVEAPGTRLAG